jgi:hypothetical protein
MKTRFLLVSVLAMACGGDDGAQGSDGPSSTDGGPSTTDDPSASSSESSSSGATSTGIDDATESSTTVDDADSTTMDSADSTTGGEGGIAANCGYPDPCDGFQWQCNPQPNGDCAEGPYDAALVCILQRLAAGEQAQLYVSFNGYLSGEVDWIDIATFGDGSALRQYAMESPRDLETYFDPTELCTLRPAEYFEACLADEGDFDQHVACMNPYEWFEDDCITEELCR